MPPVSTTTATTFSATSSNQGGSASKNVVKKRRITRSIIQPPKSLVRSAEKSLPHERDIELAIHLLASDTPMNDTQTAWVSNYQANTEKAPLAVLTCATTITAVAAVIDSLTSLCNDTVTPKMTAISSSQAVTDETCEDMDAISRRLTQIAEQMSGIAARFKARNQQFSA